MIRLIILIQNKLLTYHLFKTKLKVNPSEVEDTVWIPLKILKAMVKGSPRETVKFDKNYKDLVKSLILSTNIENVISKKNISPLFFVTGTMFTYFSILIVNYGDFSRYAKNNKEMQYGNFSLIFNCFCE